MAGVKVNLEDCVDSEEMSVKSVEPGESGIYGESLLVGA